LFRVSNYTKYIFWDLVCKTKMDYCYNYINDANGKYLPPLSNSPFWMLGKCYKAEPSFESQATAGLTESTDFTLLENTAKCFPNLLSDFEALFWFTYRKDFPRIEPSPYTSDAGWGCMLRSGQMLLAQALARHLLGPNWRPKPNVIHPLEKKIIKCFGDYPNCPYSIHKIAQCGLKFGKNVGEWFGPSTIVQVLEELVGEHKPGFRMYVSHDGCLYLDQIREICLSPVWGDPDTEPEQWEEEADQLDEEEERRYSVAAQEFIMIQNQKRDSNNNNNNNKNKNKNKNNHRHDTLNNNKKEKGKEKQDNEEEEEEEEEKEDERDRRKWAGAGGGVGIEGRNGNGDRNGKTRWHPVLIVIPLRLGLDVMNESYIPTLKETFHFPQSLGVIGGKPRASYYFIGYQDDYVYYLDPHTIQPAVPLSKIDVAGTEFDTGGPGNAEKEKEKEKEKDHHALHEGNGDGDDDGFDDAHNEGGPKEGGIQWLRKIYHCVVPQRLPLMEIDPSLSLAFYCRTEEDLRDFCKRSQRLNMQLMTVYNIVDKTPDYLKRKRTPPKGHTEKLFSDDEDEIVFL
jgi:hypothetical protein